MTTANPFGNFNQDPFFNLGTNNPLGVDFSDFLEEEPDIPFFGALGRSNATPNQRAFFQSQRQNIFGQFLGQLDEQIRAGGLPSARFNDFINDFDFSQNFNQQFGPQTAQFNPRTRFFNR